MNLLRPLETLWHAVNAAKRFAYERELVASRALPRPVLSVGNVSMGGSGKTPTVIHLAKFLVARGWRVAILSRGFRRRAENEISIVEGDDPTVYGDEPVLIRRHVPECDVVVGANRFAAGSWYLNRRDCDLFLLDDGFQHLRLRRDVDVVIDDPAAKLLRESRGTLRKADFVLVRTDRGDELRPSEGSYRLEIEPTALLLGGERHGLGMLVGKKVVAFSGLANNERFFRSIESLGARIVAREEFSDHARYDAGVLDKLQQLGHRAGADFLLTTEKDWVKFPRLHAGVLLVEAVITPLAGFHDAMIEMLERACRSKGRIVPEFERQNG